MSVAAGSTSLESGWEGGEEVLISVQGVNLPTAGEKIWNGLPVKILGEGRAGNKVDFNGGDPGMREGRWDMKDEKQEKNVSGSCEKMVPAV